MPRFKLYVTETVEYVILVDAGSEEEARDALDVAGVDCGEIMHTERHSEIERVEMEDNED
jgi:hypothetical protein